MIALALLTISFAKHCLLTTAVVVVVLLVVLYRLPLLCEWCLLGRRRGWSRWRCTGVVISPFGTRHRCEGWR